MTAFDATQPTIEALPSWTFASLMPTRDENDVASTRLPRYWWSFARTVRVLRHASKRNDRQVLPAAAMLDDQLHHGSRPSSNERVRMRAGRPSRAARTARLLAVDVASLDIALPESMLFVKKAAIP